MTEAGQRAVDTARANGSWQVLDAVEAGDVPDDLAAVVSAAAEGRRASRRG
jgi:hypothetical protein